jgi:hypothetical protein
MSGTVKISVLVSTEEFERFESFCREQGHKKSTLIAKLIRDHLDAAGYGTQGRLFKDAADHFKRDN